MRQLGFHFLVHLRCWQLQLHYCSFRCCCSLQLRCCYSLQLHCSSSCCYWCYSSWSACTRIALPLAVLVESQDHRGLRFRDDPRARLHLAVLCCGPPAPRGLTRRGLTFMNLAHQVCATLLSEAEVCCSTLHPKRNSRLFCQRPGSFPKDTTRPQMLQHRRGTGSS